MTRPPIHPPKQARSQATLDRLCRAAAKLLETKHWHQISVQEIAREASSSVGSFYARFPDKEALLDLLDQRYTEEVLELTAVLIREAQASTRSLEDLAELMVAGLVEFHRARRGLIRALVLRARRYREAAFNERTERMNAAVMGVLKLLEGRMPKDHEEPSHRIFLAFSFLFSALRDRILFPETIAAPFPLDDRELTRELTIAFLSYLRAA